MPERILPFEYGGQFHVIKVNSWGYVRFAGFQIYLSETMIGQYIEFRPSEDGEVFIACYRNYKKSGVLRQGWLTGETKNQQAVKPAKVLPMSCHNCYPCCSGQESRPYNGSSPRAWGTYQRGSRTATRLRFIPTGVGNIPCLLGNT